MSELFTDEQRRELAGRARTLHERFEGVPNVEGDDPPMDPDRIVEVWRSRYPDDGSFEDRLAREGLTPDDVREAVAATRWPADEPLPDWVEQVETLVRHVERRPETGDLPVTDDTPFAELAAAVLAYARDRLPELPVSDGTASSMVEGLLGQVQGLWLRALYVEFKSFVEHHDPEVAAADPEDFQDPPTTYYEQFVDAMFERGFRNLCLEYPVLSRQLVAVVDHWVDAVTELCRRVRADREDLVAKFDVEGAVTDLEPLADDAHARGRLPVLVSFESGAVVYKPRPVDGSVAFFTVLDRLSEHLPVSAFKTPASVPRDDYGWMEYVEYRDLQSGSTASRYYERAGALLCVAYALDFTDINVENLIIDGEHPIVVDGETLFHPHFEAEAKPVTTPLGHTITHTVLSTSLLPMSLGYPRTEDDEEFSAFIAGFGHESDRTEIESLSMPSFEAVNTDVMAVASEHAAVDATTNTPTVDGEDQPPEDHLDDLVEGFSETYECIQQLHEAGRFFSEIVTPDLVADVENRLVYRRTLRYVSILLGAVARNPLRDGARLTVEFERLTGVFFDGRISSDRFWPLYDAERRALRRRDVPRFTSTPRDRTILHDGEPIDLAADASGYELSRRRVDGMDATDRRRQAALVRQSYEQVDREQPTRPGVELTDDRLRSEAVSLFDDVVDAAIPTERGKGWVSFMWTNPVRVVPARPGLYYGRAGIALTAAALHGATGEQRYRQLTDDILGTIVDENVHESPAIGVGGTRGTGSLVYTLSVVAEILDEPSYRDAALAAARTLSDERIAADDSFDVMEGSAGALLGLLAYHDRFGDPDVLDRAVACGEHLLDGRIEVGDHRAWATFSDEYPSPGFAHGTGGIAYALARLAEQVDDPRYETAVEDALAFEAAQDRTDSVDWGTLHGGHSDWIPEWCHGLTGDALARYGVGHHLDDGSMLAEARSQLSTIASAEPLTVDNLCCGNLARVEAQLVGSRRLDGDFGDPTELAELCIGRRADGGVLDLPGHSALFPNVSFFDGITGAAYTLLRLRDPDELPCVLLLE